MAGRDLKPGTVVGDRYVINAAIGNGRIGAVYRATDRTNQMAVALKIFAPELVPGTKSFNYLSSMLSERRAINNPNVMRLIDVGPLEMPGGPRTVYVVLEWIEGSSLKARIAELPDRPLTVHGIIKLLGQVANGLAALHTARFPLLDLNPDRILITNDEILKLPAFGFISSDQWIRESAAPGNGSFVDYRYVAPEMLAQGGVMPGDLAADIYLLGILAFELGCGTVPFEANQEVMVHLHRHEPIPPLLRQCGLPSWYEDLVRRMMEKEPAKRPVITDVVRMLNNQLTGDSESLERSPRYTRRNGIEVLFVEDNRLDLLSFARFAKVERYPFTYTIARSVNHARELLEQSKVDVVVSDFMLPDGTGVDVVRAAGKTPTIILTGAGREDVAALAVRSGAFDYLSKDALGKHLTLLPGAVERAHEWNTLRKTREGLTKRIHELEKLRLSALVQKIILAKLEELVTASLDDVSVLLPHLQKSQEGMATQEKMREKLESCLRLCSHPLELNGIIDDSTDDDGELAEECEIFTVMHLTQAVDHVLEQIRCQGLPPSTEIIVKNEIPGEQALKMPQVSFELALMHLCRNAQEAIGSAHGEITITLSKRFVFGLPGAFADNGLALCITVEDTGPGIPESIRERMFEPFFSTKRNGSRDERHLGIGLTLVKQLVEETGGVISVEYPPRGGTRIVLQFPLGSEQASGRLEARESC